VSQIFTSLNLVGTTRAETAVQSALSQTEWRDDLENSARIDGYDNITVANGNAMLSAAAIAGTSWTKQGMVIDAGPSAFDYPIATACDVLVDNGTYKMWYSGCDGTTYRIAYATSPDGVMWTKRGVVMSPLGTGYETAHVGFPSVLKLAGGYRMWYGGYDGANWRILSASSPDGLNWTRQGLAVNIGGTNEGLLIGSPDVVLDSDGTYKMYYNGGNKSSQPYNFRIFMATSPDGVTWTKRGMALDIGGTYESMDVYGATVVKNGTRYYMWYTGSVSGSPNLYRICHADSPDGYNWTKRGLAVNFGTYMADMSSVENPDVVMTENGLEMFYGGSDWISSPNRWRVLLARSATALHTNGNLSSKAIAPPAGHDWTRLVVDKSEPWPTTTIKVTILDGSTGAPIIGFVNMSASDIDISTLDVVMHPTIKLLATFAGNGSATPALDSWAIKFTDNAPQINETTTGAPTTGDPYTVRAKVTDDATVNGVYIEYSFTTSTGSTPQVNVSMVHGTGWNYSATITVHANAVSFQYSITACDSGNIWNRTGAVHRQVVDNDAPSVTDATSTSPATGNTFVLNGTATDNIGLSDVRMVYAITTGSWVTERNVSATAVGANWIWVAVMPSNATWLDAAIFAVDSTGNWNKTMIYDGKVADDDAPIVGDATVGKPATGNPFELRGTATDNIGVLSVAVEYFFEKASGNTSVVRGGMAQGASHEYSLTISVPLDALALHWDISANDSGGNECAVSGCSVDVVDVVKPVAVAGEDAIVGEGGVVEFDGGGCSDNLCVDNYTWRLTHNDTSVTLYGSQASYIFWTPGNYTVALNVTDGAGNWNTDALVVRVLAAEPPAPPEDGVLSWWWLLLFAALVLILVPFFVLLVRRKEKDRRKAMPPGGPQPWDGPSSAPGQPPASSTHPLSEAPTRSPSQEYPQTASQGPGTGSGVVVPHGELLANIDKRYAEGHISEETYKMLRQKYGDKN
jgi:predicted GH43/DUF377 family glycosyl hydrolase